MGRRSWLEGMIMGMAETLTQSAPMARKVKKALENMMMESVVRENR